MDVTTMLRCRSAIGSIPPAVFAEKMRLAEAAA
jgi:hypothetical protein